MTPTLPDPPPPPPQDGGGCGGVGAIFVAVVAVVAVVMTAGAAAVAMSAMASGMSFGAAMGAVVGAGLTGVAAAGTAALAGGSMAAAFIGGAVGSMVSQGVAMAMGMQDRFSWGQVGLSAFSAAATAGLAGASNTSSLSAFAGKGLGETVARTMAVNAMTQGVGMATGLQKSFNWTSVAASGAAAGVSGWMGDSLGWKSSDPVAGVGYGTLRGLVSGGIQSQLTGQRPNWSAIAAESFGSALGDQVVSGIQNQDRARQQQKAAFAKQVRDWGFSGRAEALEPAWLSLDSVSNEAAYAVVDDEPMAQRATAAKAAPDSVRPSAMKGKVKSHNLTKSQAEYAANWKLPTAESEALNNVYPEMLLSLPMLGRSVVAEGASLTSKFMTAVFGGGLNYGAQKVFNPNQPVNWLDVGLGVVGGWWTNGASLTGTVVFNTYAASVSSGFQGQDPLPGMAGAAVGSVVGFGIGSVVARQLNLRLNPWYRSDWVTVGPYEIKGWNAPNPIPNAAALTVGGVGQESVNAGVVSGMQKGKR
ncbi:hypothetical protein [Chromobacterium haemolyticum]|uniref:hypothetical protein n=1 Tax=Chromobacterium haemolyticum TaxID=394935 RepID=UPI001C631E4A|nr:hypothetical protein [Chromobacterium haemolyticum]